MPAAVLIKAWLTLVALSVGTVLLTMAGFSGQGRHLVAGGVLLLAGIKAHVILTRYLGLARSRFWTHVFDSAIGAFLLLSFALYVFGSGA
jgi:nitric oxide reductase NorF protein